ncbi:MAG: membrane assembly protein AsmA [Rhodanobacter sp.]|nr:MAG: membrane assembly protein AsmA [Rhodanobacter sp.]TAM08879.1 MAG: membrane assembly protein AsmA [Rhodanobacter sp.]TAM36921.1 MAG: membrane assembly protein AsmA [Rhodanobacter sp.]
MPHGWRRLLIATGTVLLAALLVSAVTVYLLLRPDRFTALLQDQAQKAGLTLNLASPASPTLFPRPALELSGITLSADGTDTPLLLAARGRLTLPWRTVFGGPPAITQMEVDAPRVDLDALQAWLTALHLQNSTVAPTIPRIDTGIRIEHGSFVRGDRVLLNNVMLVTGSLAPDEPFPLDLSATTPSGAPLQLRLVATPHLRGNALLLDNIEIHAAQGHGTTLGLTGNARWHGAADAAAQLGGKLDQADSGSYTVALTLAPADQTQPLLLHLRLDGPGNHADLRLPPLALARWWNGLNAPGESSGPTQPSVPPASGSLQVAKWQLGSVSIEGLSVQSDGEGPATSASVSAPATDTPQ